MSYCLLKAADRMYKFCLNCDIDLRASYVGLSFYDIVLLHCFNIILCAFMSTLSY